MKIKVICLGKLKDKFYVDACAEYAKRLKRYCEISIVELPEERLPSNPSEKDAAQALDKEAQAVLRHLEGGEYKIALCVEGGQMDSLGFAKCIEGQALTGRSTITFVIGSSQGLAANVKSACDMRLSFSKMTFPHRLMRVILLEQVYRAFKIINGQEYHK